MFDAPTSLLHLAFLIGVGTLFSLDLADVLVRSFFLSPAGSADTTKRDSDVARKTVRVRPYALVASVHRVVPRVDNVLRSLAGLEHRVWLIDDCSGDGTIDLLRTAGFRCESTDENLHKPLALRELLARLPQEIESVLVIDPDVQLRFSALPGDTQLEGLEAVIHLFQGSGDASWTPRVDVTLDGALSRLQALEYHMAGSIGRRSLGDFAANSGVSLYQRKALEWALARHSGSVYAEDLENSLLLLADARSVRYSDRLIVETEAKHRLGALFSQRVGWSYGYLRAFASHWRDIPGIAARSFLATYHYIVFSVIIGIFLQPLRMFAFVLAGMSLLSGIDRVLELDVLPAAISPSPSLFVFAYLQYVLLAVFVWLVAVPAERRPALLPILPMFPLYSFWLSLATTVGYLNWVSLALFSKRLYRDHYQVDDSGMAASQSERARAKAAA